MNDISQELTAYFKRLGVTQEEIASKFEVSQQYISALLSGKKAFGKKQAQKFYELYGISPSWLLTGEGSMISPTGNNAQVIGYNTGTAINGNGAVVNPKSEKEDTIARMQNQIDELISQNGKLLNIIDRLTSK